MSHGNDIVARLRDTTSGYTLRTVFDEAADEIERLRKERDEARRKICEIESRGTCDSQRYARLMGWDCFKEDTDGK